MSKRIGSSEPVTFRFTSPAKGVTLIPRRAWLPLATTAAAISLSSCMFGGGGDEARLAPTPLTPDPKAAPTTAPAALAGEMQQYAQRVNAAEAKREKQKLNKMLQPNPDGPVVLASETHTEGAGAAAVKPAESTGGAKTAEGSKDSGAAAAAPTSDVKGEATAKADSGAMTQTGAVTVEIGKTESSAAKMSGAPGDGGTSVAVATGGNSVVNPTGTGTAAMSAMSAVNVNVAPVEAGAPEGPGISAPAMDGVLEAVRKCAAAHPQNINYALALQLLETAENGKAGDPAPINNLNPVDQKLVVELSAAVQNLTAQAAGPKTTLAQRAAPLVEAAKSWETDKDLELPRLVLASRVDSFGVYNQVEPKFENGKRHVVIIYCEVANFATKKMDDGMFETHLTQQDTLSTEDGLLVWRPNPEDVEDHSRNQRKDFYLVKKLTIPETLAIGKYKLEMAVTDKVSNKYTKIPLEIEIVAAK